jgi:hypothetical protein
MWSTISCREGRRGLGEMTTHCTLEVCIKSNVADTSHALNKLIRQSAVPKANIYKFLL